MRVLEAEHTALETGIRTVETPKKSSHSVGNEKTVLECGTTVCWPKMNRPEHKIREGQ